MNRDIVWLDPSLHTHNQGDKIIADAVSGVLTELDLEPALRLSTHHKLSWEGIEALTDPLFIIGGTNLLNSDHPMRRWWRITPRDASRLAQRVITCGVGWWQYQRDPNLYTRWLYRKTLAETTTHSVRDSYTQQKLERLGIPAANTGCPTTWGLSTNPERRTSRGRRVIVALTDYAQDPKADSQLLELLDKLYDEIVIWPQGSNDVEYISSLGVRHSILNGDLDEFNHALEEPDTDYVGTRLHAGIRALQLGARSTIVEVDNRAREMGRDIGLPVISRTLDDAGRAFISEPRELRLSIPHEQIRDWLSSTGRWAATAHRLPQSSD